MRTLVYESKVCMINKYFSSIETTSLNDRLDLAFFSVGTKGLLKESLVS